jgi:hypothetical protein
VTPGAPSDEAVRALASEILARSEYARFRTLDAKWLQDILRRLVDFFAWIDSLWVTSPVLYVLLLGGLLVFAVGLLVHIVWTIRVALAATAPEGGPVRAPAGPDLAAEAQALAGASRFLEAAHTLQLACLGTMLKSGALELARHEPNRTLRERLGAARLPERERREFLTLLGRLEGRWFRDRRPAESDRELFDAWRELHGRLRKMAAST